MAVARKVAKGSEEPRVEGVASIRQLAAAWMAHCRAEGLLASSMRTYGQGIDVLLSWCERQGIEGIDQLDQPAVNRLAGELLARKRRDGKPISRTSVDTYLRPVRHFTDWARRQGYDLLGRPLPIRQARQPKDVLTRAEIQRMEDAATSERDKLIVRLLGDTGMRIGELCRLRPTDLIERNRQWFLYVQGKGQNDRFVPVPRIHRRLRTWIERGRREPCADVIMTVLHARGGFYPALSYSGAWKAVRGAAQMADIAKPVHPHLLRHSFITHLRRKGYNDAQVSLVVGNHSALARYTWMDSSDVYGLMADLD